MLDRTEQRILGVLIEKELAVPESYPMTENALVLGCNQKNNREPVMELASFQVAGALMALQEKGWIAKVDGGGRVARYRHRVVDKLVLKRQELAVLAELLLRGPQAPGALKPRVLRMGYEATPEQIEALLRQLAARPDALVEQLPMAPRERDRRWRQLLGPMPAADQAPRREAELVREAPAEYRQAIADPVEYADATGLLARVEALEHAIADLRAQLARLQSPN